MTLRLAKATAVVAALAISCALIGCATHQTRATSTRVASTPNTAPSRAFVLVAPGDPQNWPDKVATYIAAVQTQIDADARAELERQAEAQRQLEAASRVPVPMPTPVVQPGPAARSYAGVGECTGFVIPDYIIIRESGGNPWAKNPNSDAFGCAQTLLRHYYGGSCSGLDPYTIQGQRDCVFILSNGGTNLAPWAL